MLESRQPNGVEAQKPCAGAGVNPQPQTNDLAAKAFRREHTEARKDSKRGILGIVRKGLDLIFGCFTTRTETLKTPLEDSASIADDATLASVNPVGYTQSEDYGFARTVEIIYSPKHGEDRLKYGVVVFDSGSTYNFVTAEWLQSNRIPFEKFSTGPRVVAKSFQGAEITAVGEIRGLKFGRPRNQSPIEDAAGNEISLKWKFWQGHFYILESCDAGLDEKPAPGEPIEFIVGAETMRRYDLYRPSPLLLVANHIRLPSPPPAPVPPPANLQRRGSKARSVKETQKHGEDKDISAVRSNRDQCSCPSLLT